MDERKEIEEEKMDEIPDLEIEETVEDPADAVPEEIAVEELADEGKVFAVNEITDLRKENCKVFRMSDGSEEAVFYPEAVHAFNEETELFEEIDNTLTVDEDGKHFKNGKNHFTAFFSKDADSDELFSVEKNGHHISVSARKAKTPIDARITPVVRKASVKSAVDAAVCDKLCFENVLPDTDLEYSVSGAGVKENIVIHKKATSYRYPFVLECGDLIVEHDEEGKEVVFSDPADGREVFRVPAPFMSDAAGETSKAVSYELRQQEDGKFAFTVVADGAWINDEARAFPVTIDPQIVVNDSAVLATYSWVDGMMSAANIHTIGTTGNGDGPCNVNRMYLRISPPVLPRCPRIKKAELRFTQQEAVGLEDAAPKIGLYGVTGGIAIGDCTPVMSGDLIDYEKARAAESGDVIYTFDVSAMLDEVYFSQYSYSYLVLKAINEDDTEARNVKLYGSSSSVGAPTLVINYESDYGSENSYRSNTHSIGRFGQGSVDLQRGNLVLDSDDFAWAGNRMPVTIKHIFNNALFNYQYTANSSIKLNVADFSSMILGTGWRLNLMQSMMQIPFQYEGVLIDDGFIYTDETGNETYFKQEEAALVNGICERYFRNVDGGNMTYVPERKELDTGSDVRLFDDAGRLIKITDEYGNHIDITYTAGRITSVTDGADREFAFAYDSTGHLTSITAPDNTVVSYTYNGNTLNEITYPDGRKARVYDTGSSKYIILKDENGDPIYKVRYGLSSGRVVVIREYGVENGADVLGTSTWFEYHIAGRNTKVRVEENGSGSDPMNTITTVYNFDDEGNVVGEYAYTADTGNTGVSGDGEGINPYAGDGGVGVVSNINNLLTNHNFEANGAWNEVTDSGIEIYKPLDGKISHFGSKYMHIKSTLAVTVEKGVYQQTETLPAGEYAFSAYMHVCGDFEGVNNPGAYLRVLNMSNVVLSESEHLSIGNDGYIQVVAPFTLANSSAVKVEILINGKGGVYVDGAQLENNPYANDYNMLENGNFERDLASWTGTGAAISTETKFNMSKSLMIPGDLESARNAKQDVIVKGRKMARETFTLSGWAKGYAIPDRDREGVETEKPKFRLRAVIHYLKPADGEETFTANFSTCTEEWQMASVQFCKSKFAAVDHISIYCDYDYNVGTAFFDDIQLTRESLEDDLTEEDFSGTADYTEADEEETESSESINNTDEEIADFEELRDAYGNARTETTFTDGELGTIYRAFRFNTDSGSMSGNNAGNDLIEEVDPRGRKTKYTVDGYTSRNTQVTDRAGTKTLYEYDDAGRVIGVTNKNSSNVELGSVSYSYDPFDNMSEIVRGDGLKYVLAYNGFHNLESIGVDGMTDPLIRYTYKSGNGRLKEIEYANGAVMRATYDSAGRMIAERWYDSSDTLTAHYRYVYDGKGNIVRSIDILGGKEYTYTYSNEQLARSSESNITLDANGNVTAKALINSVYYSYDADGNLVKKTVAPAVGTKQVIWVENREDGNPIYKFTAGTKNVLAHSKNDSFGRKVFDEVQFEAGAVSRRYEYEAGVATDEHISAEKVKSTPTTQLVSKITFSNGRVISYQYSYEDHIKKVTDSGDATYNYTYDALGQLLTETKDGVVVTSMTYDNYGNILTKNGKVYTYGDTVWKDRLTAYDGQPITYDAQGNPTSYLGHTLVWEKGRQLKSFDTNAYTYNANGIRTSKTIGGVTHTYTLEGAQILREEWGNNVLVPMYDNEGEICGIIFNDEPYFFLRTLQGDVVSIIDKTNTEVAGYTYDAWGACTIKSDTSGVNIATVNPFRYRSYYYDTETGLYYLQSRYYDPVVARFINADEAMMATFGEEILPKNLFTYCANDPVDNVDDFGLFAILGVSISLGAVAAFVALSCFLLMFLFSRQFREAFIAFITGVINAVINGVRYLANAISDIVKAAKIGRKYSGYEKHHIVAESDSRAAWLRDYIRKRGVSVNDKYNIVKIKNTLHRHLHTNAYFAAVEIVIVSAVSLKKGTPKNAIISALIFIGILLKAASAMV